MVLHCYWSRIARQGMLGQRVLVMNHSQPVQCVQVVGLMRASHLLLDGFQLVVVVLRSFHVHLLLLGLLHLEIQNAFERFIAHHLWLLGILILVLLLVGTVIVIANHLFCLGLAGVVGVELLSGVLLFESVVLVLAIFHVHVHFSGWLVFLLRDNVVSLGLNVVHGKKYKFKF